MATKLRVRNYQSIADARLQAEGLTVITGKSNLGKTALVRSVSAMLFGNPGDYYIRRGEDYVGGAIQIDDGTPLKIVWRKVSPAKRKPNLQPVLEVNGQTHTKIGKDHKSLTAPHGILEIETSTARLRPQIAMQHDPIFLVTNNETTVAEVFKMLGRVDIITEAQRLAKRDLREKEETRKVRATDRVVIATKIQELDYVVDARKNLTMLQTKAQAALDQIVIKQDLVDRLKELTQLKPITYPTPPREIPFRFKQDWGILEALKQLKQLEPIHYPTPPKGLPQRNPILPVLRQFWDLETDGYDAQQYLFNMECTMANLEQEKIAMEKELGICPTCKRSFDANHVSHP